MIVINGVQFNRDFLACNSLEVVLNTMKSVPENIVREAFAIANPTPKKRVRKK
jgi:hypothetical protein